MVSVATQDFLLSRWMRAAPRCGAQTSHCNSFSCCGAQAPGHECFSSCSMWAQKLWFPGSRLQAQQLWCTGLVALWHVESSQIRDWTCVSCIGRWVLYHWATKEAPFGISCREGLVIIHFLSLWLSETVFLCLKFFRDKFISYRILCWQLLFFFFQHFTCHPTTSWPLVSDEKSTVNIIKDPLHLVSHFCLTAFKSLCFFFQQFDYDASQHGSLLILSVLG